MARMDRLLETGQSPQSGNDPSPWLDMQGELIRKDLIETSLFG
jgi:hypothetical protein